MSDPRDWQEDALCAQTDPEMFHPEKGGSPKWAKRVCASCPVIDQCLEWAMTQSPEVDRTAGVLGGLTYRERTLLRKSAA